MIKVFTILFVVLSLSAGEYWSVDEYFLKNQGEKKKFAAFDKVVQQKASVSHPRKQKPVKIIMVYPGKQASDYWRRSKKEF